jgi:hypothetical protein
MSNESIIRDLLGGIEFDDPRLYDLLDKAITDLYKGYNNLFPPSATGRFGITGQVSLPDTSTGFSVTIYNNNVKLTWDAVDGINFYELRYLSGTAIASDWDTATAILRTSTTSADINPVAIPLTFGNHSFLLKTINSNGDYSDIANVITINVPVISAPTITPTVITNFVLLNWTIPDSVFVIAYYNVYKDGVLQGKVNESFKTIFETVGGTFTYIVEPVDIVGNVGTPSAGSVVLVSNPADFTFHDVLTSILSGTKTNCKIESIAGVDYLLACIDTAKTFENHFIDNAWANPQAQVTAGYPIYIQPAKTTGSYVETFDFGSVIDNVIIVMNWNTIVVTGSVTTATSTVEYSTDGATWSTPVVGYTTFAASVRYVRFTMNFVGSDDKALAYFYNLQSILNVRREQDGGTVSVLAADVGGTVVSFNKTFKSIDTITLAPVSTVLQTAIYDFAFPVNPTTFKILLFNSAGARVNGTVSWGARGII